MIKAQKGRPLSRVELAMNKFQKEGPYTFREALRVAKMCARTHDWQIGDIFDVIPHKFPPAEMAKMTHAKQHCTPEEYEAWKEGTGGWRFHHLSGKMTDAQLEIIAELPPDDFDALLEHTDPRWYSTETRIAVLKDLRFGAGEEHKKYKQERAEMRARIAAKRKAREASPVRKK